MEDGETVRQRITETRSGVKALGVRNIADTKTAIPLIRNNWFMFVIMTRTIKIHWNTLVVMHKKTSTVISLVIATILTAYILALNLSNLAFAQPAINIDQLVILAM
jgi:hypothetical protein